jgi:aconitate hydratase
MQYPVFHLPDRPIINTAMIAPPAVESRDVTLDKGPNIQPLPAFDPFPETVEAPVLLKLGDDVSTDAIMPAGEQVLPYRSNIPEISKFVFARTDPTFYRRAMQSLASGCVIVAGANYGQGSSREHAAIAPRFLGLKAVLAKSFARIHERNLVNFGILPLTFANPDDWERIEQGDVLWLPDVRAAIQQAARIKVVNKTKGDTYSAQHALTGGQVDMILSGSLLNLMRKRQAHE